MNEKVDYVYVDDDREAQRAVDYLKTQDRLGYDTETTGLNIIGKVSRLLLMQLGTEEVTYLFDARKIDTQILKEVEAGTFFKKKTEVWWVCRECGYMHFGKQPPEECPACGHSQAFYQLKMEEY